MLFFLLPRLPELALSARNFQAIRDMFKLRPARKPAFTDTDIEQYIDALSQPGALTAALNYYRANFTMANAHRFARSPALSMETLIIWGSSIPPWESNCSKGSIRLRLTVAFIDSGMQATGCRMRHQRSQPGAYRFF